MGSPSPKYEFKFLEFDHKMMNNNFFTILHVGLAYILSCWLTHCQIFILGAVFKA